MAERAFDKGHYQMAADLDFYFWPGSTYTYLTVNRIDEVAANAGVKVNWKPFYLRAILRDHSHVPFPEGRAKTEYMWRDLERRAHLLGIPYPAKRPIYPTDPETLNFKAAMIAHEQGWGKDFLKASYDWWFIRGRAPGIEDNLAAMLLELGRDPNSILELAHAPEMDSKLSASADQARALGLFGSPHFVVEQEVFWGDDRLEQAIAWAKDTPCGRSVSDPLRTHNGSAR